MKKSLIKKLGIGLVAGAVTLFFPNKVNSLENLVDGVGKINGNVIETINEIPAKFVDLRLKEYLGNGVIGDELGSCQTDSNGNFSLDIDTSSNYAKVFISKSDSSYYQAERFVNLEDSILLDIVERHMVDVLNIYSGGSEMDKMDFLQFFNEWCRAPPVGGIPTHRWTEQPKWYIRTTNATQDKISMAENIIQNCLPQFTKIVRNGSFIINPSIEKGENPPENGSNNYIIIKWKNTGGSGAHAEYLDGNKIYSGLILFNPDLAGPTTSMEESIQVLGPTSEVETRYFYDENGNMLSSGLELGKFLYSRPIGNKTPDIDPEPNVNIIRYLRPVTNLTVEDVPDDNGNQLELNWSPSVSEGKGLVSRYRIYRGEDNNLDNAALIDSVNVGSTGFIDRNVPLNNTLYYYWVETVGINGNMQRSEKYAQSNGNTVNVEEKINKFYLGDAYPNPFNSNTTINYTIPESSNVELVVYDINGRRIKTLDCGWRDGGSYKANWDGKDKKGNEVGNGVYLLQLNAGKYNKTGKMMLVK